MDKSYDYKRINGPLESLTHEDLVYIIRGNGRSLKKENAYIILQERVRPKITFIIKQFYIPGLGDDDILQEALYALRFKAIPDYTPTKGKNGEIYPFDKFAVLCIRRHLSTILKGSFQNKKKTLNTSLSLDQNRGGSVDDDLFLVDILPKTEGSIADNLSEKEYYKKLFSLLVKDLSQLEQQVFVLYANKYSYEDISAIINRYYKKKELHKKINVKSIDNALSRIKQKAHDIYFKVIIKDTSKEEKT